MKEDELLLPEAILARASVRGREYAWPVADIPEVIEAARVCGLFNIGGQLQFRFPGATCECYWIDVDGYKELPPDAENWRERVEMSAEATLKAFNRLVSSYDFIAEGRKAFSKHFSDFESGDGDIREAMCFVWYVKSERPEEE